MEGMACYPDKHFDLSVIDPPYGLNNGNAERNKSRGVLAKAQDYPAYYGNDNKPPGEEYFRELFRVSKNQILFGANHYISRIPYDSPCWIVWDKNNGQTDYADCELAWTSFRTATRLFKYTWHGMLQGNMKQKETRIHPNQKPVALYGWIFRNYARKGDKILDTHVGSASSLIAAYRAGLSYVGFEKDAYYYGKAQERLTAEMSQTRIEQIFA
jgi:site-specific DNA-methyltransferase (adenine-specific)